ncbi:GNAT family N-acetyltransferase [Elioraea sp.]|uniref:GNAT family N-acetyltransferase n=1 Tax=Elioraea sp. TaxID=2185103 RepID=UPI0025BA1742|nr:GNAT family N-acetyltransferase [Elioraea sp.]
MSETEIEALAAPNEATIAAIADGLIAYNLAASGIPFAPEPLWLVARNHDDAVIGGIKARVAWGWISVEWLWVHEAWRGRRIGAGLLQRAEAEGRTRGCAGVVLDTFSFQAPGFYEKQGYVAFGRLEGLPAGHARIHYAKRL